MMNMSRITIVVIVVVAAPPDCRAFTADQKAPGVQSYRLPDRCRSPPGPKWRMADVPKFQGEFH